MFPFGTREKELPYPICRESRFFMPDTRLLPGQSFSWNAYCGQGSLKWPQAPDSTSSTWERGHCTSLFKGTLLIRTLDHFQSTNLGLGMVLCGR